MGAARERVRVARRLSELALVTAAFSSGELSYSKVRAITRVATDANEAMLVDLARAMTASHLERVVRCYRLAGADPENDTDPVDHYRDRFLSTQWNDDGSLTIRAKLPPAEGAMVIEALRRAADSLYRDRQRRQRSRSANADDVSAETSNKGGDDVSADTSEEDWAAWDPPEGDGLATDVSAEPFGSETAPSDADEESPAPWDGWGAAQADALVAMAETVVADGLRSGGGPGRHLVIVHTDADTATGQADRTAAYLDNGPRLAAETVRRLMCDSSLAFALEGPDGTVINLSPRAPSIPTALVRAVKLRDGGCVFPGCTRSAFVDVHHIRHRADGGANSAANCCTLCRVHHRMIHEGGFTVTTAAPGHYCFYRPDGTQIGAKPVTVSPGDDHLREFNAQHGITPTAETPVPHWDGRHPDYPLIMDILLDADGLLRDPTPTT